MKKIYINFGAGNPVENWINLDSSPFFMAPRFIHKALLFFGVKRSNDYLLHDYTYFKFSVEKKLPFDSESVTAIHSSHVQEHLTIAENEHFFNESHRILKTGGILRVIVPDLEKKILLDKMLFSLENSLLTLPVELKQQKIRAMLEAVHGFPSFHKTLFVREKVKKFFSKKWHVSLGNRYLESDIDKKMLMLVEKNERTKQALIFELIKK